MTLRNRITNDIKDLNDKYCVKSMTGWFDMTTIPNVYVFDYYPFWAWEDITRAESEGIK